MFVVFKYSKVNMKIPHKEIRTIDINISFKTQA